MKRIIAALFLTLSSLALAQDPEPVRVLTHSSFDLPAELLTRFTEQTGYRVELLPAGDAGEVVNRAILTAGRPLGDVLFGVDGSLLQRAAEAGVFQPYRSPLLELVPDEYHLSADNLVTPIDVGWVAFNLDLDWFARDGRPLPASLADLVAPEYRGLTVVQDPASSSTGLAFMLATIAHFGPESWLDWWAELRDNDVLVTSGWTDAYYTAFSRYGGDRPVVLSYASSPAAEVMFAGEPLASAPTANLLCDGCVYRQVEAAGVLAGAGNVAGAEAFIDFLLSEQVQAAIPEAMFVYPVVSGTPLPAEFHEYAEIPVSAGEGLAASVIADGQEEWLLQWTRVVLQGRAPADVR